METGQETTENIVQAVEEETEAAVEQNVAALSEENRRKLIAICALIALTAAAVVGWQLFRMYGKERASEAKMENIRQLWEMAVPLEHESANASEAGDSEKLISQEGSYQSFFAQNEDMAAWLKVDGTVIDYPVMQTMRDENYYLKRDFYGNADEAGCLILDTDSDLQGTGTTNLIIHGHNMKMGTMFGNLADYKNKEYYTEHKYMELYTETERRSYEVLAVFYSQVYYSTDQVFKYYNFFQAENERDFRYFYENIKKLSLYDTGVTAEMGDHFLTLSTCSYHVEDGRFVVVAKEIARTEL